VKTVCKEAGGKRKGIPCSGTYPVITFFGDKKGRRTECCERKEKKQVKKK
jgi:hypothetical protein